jgi:hypothetical protein
VIEENKEVPRQVPDGAASRALPKESREERVLAFDPRGGPLAGRGGADGRAARRTRGGCDDSPRRLCSQVPCT